MQEHKARKVHKGIKARPEAKAHKAAPGQWETRGRWETRGPRETRDPWEHKARLAAKVYKEPLGSRDQPGYRGQQEIKVCKVKIGRAHV